MKKDGIRILFRTGYSGGVKAEVTINGVDHILELDHLEEYIKDAIESKGFRIEKTNRQKYPRLFINK